MNTANAHVKTSDAFKGLGLGHWMRKQDRRIAMSDDLCRVCGNGQVIYDGYGKSCMCESCTRRKYNSVFYQPMADGYQMVTHYA